MSKGAPPNRYIPSQVRNIQFRSARNIIPASPGQMGRSGRSNRIPVTPSSAFNRNGRIYIPIAREVPSGDSEVLSKVADEILVAVHSALLENIVSKKPTKNVNAHQAYQCLIDQENDRIGLPRGTGRCNHPKDLACVGEPAVPVEAMSLVDLSTLPRDQNGKVVHTDGQRFYVNDYTSETQTLVPVRVYVEEVPDPSGVCTIDNPSGTRKQITTVADVLEEKK